MQPGCTEWPVVEETTSSPFLHTAAALSAGCQNASPAANTAQLDPHAFYETIQHRNRLQQSVYPRLFATDFKGLPLLFADERNGRA